MNIVRTFLGTAAALAFSAGAHAALVQSSPTCTASILTPAYTACGGSFAGNNLNQAADVNAYIGTHFGAGLLFQGSSNEAGTFGPFTSDQTGATGTLTFDAPVDGPFVLALKAANEFSLFYFNGVGPAIGSIGYSTLGVAVNANGIPNGLSHATLYAASSLPVTAVPEPSTYALMLGGLSFIGFLARRRRHPR